MRELTVTELSARRAFEAYGCIVEDLLKGEDTYYGRYAELMEMSEGQETWWGLPEDGEAPEGQITQAERTKCAAKIIEYLTVVLASGYGELTATRMSDAQAYNAGYSKGITVYPSRYAARRAHRIKHTFSDSVGLWVDVHIFRNGNVILTRAQ